MKLFMVIPAYNEDKTIKKVLEELLTMKLDLIVVDDGSKDKTYEKTYETLGKHPNQGFIYRHVINRGLGASLKTGVEAALSKNADIIVTFDADGQHHPEDIKNVIKPITDSRADVVIGTRDFNEMPLAKKLGNQIMNVITLIFYGIHVQDSQSGFRAFSRKSAELINLHSRDYGVSSEIIYEIKKNNLKMEEIPIKTIYTDYSLSKGTDTKVGLKILAKLIRNILK